MKNRFVYDLRKTVLNDSEVFVQISFRGLNLLCSQNTINHSVLFSSLFLLT